MCTIAMLWAALKALNKLLAELMSSIVNKILKSAIRLLNTA